MPSALQLPQQRRELLLFEIAQARGGLVQQQQRGIGGERARDLDDPLLAERQAARRVVEMRRKPDALDRARGLRLRARLLGAVEREARRRTTPALPRKYAPSATLSSTLIPGTSFTCWNVRPMPRRAISNGMRPAIDSPRRRSRRT